MYFLMSGPGAEFEVPVVEAIRSGRRMHTRRGRFNGWSPIALWIARLTSGALAERAFFHVANCGELVRRP
jgi:hypothetical protein